MFNRWNIVIHFAHRTCKWTNEAKGNAAVDVIIVGFSNVDITVKRSFAYDDVYSEPLEISSKNINAYLIDGRSVFIESTTKAIHNYPKITKGSQPTDGGNLLLNGKEYLELITNEPEAKKWIRKFTGAEEFLHNINRYCLWLNEITPNELHALKLVKNRVELVRKEREKSPTPSVRNFAKYPTLFTQNRQPKNSYLAIPRHASENRPYVPIAYLDATIICGDALTIIPHATLYVFGVVQSKMHNVWGKTVCGRLESRIRYSPSVYNNFPWPEAPTKGQTASVEAAASCIRCKSTVLAKLSCRFIRPEHHAISIGKRPCGIR